MKWSVSVRRNNEAFVVYQKIIKEGWHNELFGLRKWRVVNVVPAESIESGMECYFVELQGTLLYYLEQLYFLHYKHHSNTVIPYWLSERHVVKT